MEAKIGPYTITQRTKYSKIQILDENNEDLLNNPNKKNIYEKIVEDYYKQTIDINKYFEIENGCLESFKKEDIEYLFIPEDVSIIKAFVFADSNIKFIHFPQTLKSIGQGAFKNCKDLEEIILPDSVENLGGVVFGECKKLQKVILSNSLKMIPTYAFNECKNIKKLFIPDSVTRILDFAFDGCRFLQEINIPKNLNKFGDYPFSSSEINTLIINHNLECSNAKGQEKFLLNSSINMLKISKNVEKINEKIFNKQEGWIRTIKYLGSKEDFNKFKKNNKSFLKMFKNTNIDIEENLDNLTRIDNPKKEDIKTKENIER